MKTFRDPIHNIIHFDKDSEKLLLDLIDTPEFQRLRHIKQLGLSSYTYPGAEHTRFAHSLGVTHLMKRFIEKITSLKGVNKKYIEELSEHKLLALSAALLHDIGHGPFSHALEKTTKVRHEKWTIEIIMGDTEVNSLLESYKTGFSQEVADVIRRTHSSRAVVKLLSSQLDTDRIDYLLRDSKMTGAGYGSFDLEWLINVLRIGESNGEIEVGLDKEKGLSIAEDFVMARYYMYVNVYFHKTTRSAELLIDKILERALELKEAKEEIDIPYDLEHILTKGLISQTLKNYLNLTDNTIWHYIWQWRKHKDNILSDLCDRLTTRKLFKCIQTELDPMDLFERVQKFSSERCIPYKYFFLRDEAISSSYKDTYILQTPKLGEKDTEREASEQIFLFDNKGNNNELSDLSDIIRQIRNKKISIRRIYVPDEFKNMLIGG